MKKHALPIILLLTMCLALSLTGCKTDSEGLNGLFAADPTPTPTPTPAPITELTMVVTADDIAQLDDYPDLQKLDLTGSDCYAEIRAWMTAHPNVAVTYTVDLLGTTYPNDQERLDLSAMTADRVTEAAEALAGFTGPLTVELMAADGTTQLTKADVKALQAAAPEAEFHYTFDLFGTTFSTTDMYIMFERKTIGDEGVTALREAMDIMPNLYSVRLDDCGTTSAVMAQLRTDYPNVQIDWRVYFGKYNCMTDEEVLRITNGLKDEHIGEMQYLTKARYVDLGHNESLKDISFFKYMPDVEVVILSGSAVSDLTPLENCKKLYFLEAIYCGNLKDVTPLKNCESLARLNISYTKVTQLDPLFDLPITHMVALGITNLQQSEREDFRDHHEDAIRVWYGTQPYGYGWRYIDQGYTFDEYYKAMRIIFNYDNVRYYTGMYEGKNAK